MALVHLRDWGVDVQLTALDALPKQDGRERLRHIPDRIRRVWQCRTRAVDVEHAKPVLPYDALSLDDSGGEPGDTGLLAQRIEIPLEQGERQTLCGAQLGHCESGGEHGN